MIIKRRFRKLKVSKNQIIVQNLVPADFLDEEMWPFNYYYVKDEEKKKKLDYSKSKADKGRVWNLKPKAKEEDEHTVEDNLKLLLEKGIVEDKYEGILKDFDRFKEKKPMDYANILNTIYALTYELTPLELMYGGQKRMNKRHLEMIYFQCRDLGVEPYSLISNLQEELPSYYNPKRNDFNLLVLNLGKTKEQEIQTEIMEKTRKELKKVRK